MTVLLAVNEIFILSDDTNVIGFIFSAVSVLLSSNGGCHKAINISDKTRPIYCRLDNYYQFVVFPVN